MANLIPYRYNRYPVTRPAYDFFSDDFFKSFFGAPSTTGASFRVDVSDKGDHYLLEADLPGAKKDDVSIEVLDGMLSINVEREEVKKEEKENYLFNERRVGKFHRSFTLNGIDEEKVAAEYVDGVLKLTLPKKAEETKTGRKIDIN